MTIGGDNTHKKNYKLNIHIESLLNAYIKKSKFSFSWHADNSDFIS